MTPTWKISEPSCENDGYREDGHRHHASVLSITFVIEGTANQESTTLLFLYWYDQAYVVRLAACHMRHIKFSSECLGRQWQRLLVFHILTEDKRASPSPAWPAKQVGHTSRADQFDRTP